MPETEAPPADPKTDTSTDDSDPPDLGEKGRAALQAERTARREAEAAARKTAKELADLREQSMSDVEKAVAKARDEGKAEGKSEVVLERVLDKVEAAAAGRFADPEDAHRLLGDPKQFIGGDGSIDQKAIKKALDDLLKAKPYLAAGPRPGGSYDGGAGQPASGTSLNDEIRSRARR